MAILKSKTKKKTQVRNELVPTVRDAYAAAKVNLEGVALLEYIITGLPQMFVNCGGRPPPLLVDDGLGSLRSASLDAVTLIVAVLAGQAEALQKKVDALLAVPVNVDVVARAVEELPTLRVVEAPPVGR